MAHRCECFNVSFILMPYNGLVMIIVASEREREREKESSWRNMLLKCAVNGGQMVFYVGGQYKESE